MKTETITLFKFEELKEEVQKKLVVKEQNSYRDIHMDFFADDCIEQIEEAGFYANDKIKLSYSLSYSQGDGLNFCATGFSRIREIIVQNLPANKSKTADVIYNACYFVMNNNNRNYSFASKSDLDFVLDGLYPNIEIIVSKVRECIEALYMDLCGTLEKNGYAEIEHQSTDEYIKEELTSKDFDYLENGNVINI